MTDPLGQSQVLPYLSELSKHGYGFTILSFEKKDRFKKEKKMVEEAVDRAGIRWVPLFFTKNPPVFSKMYDRWQMKRKAAQLHRKYSFDMIHCRSYIAAEVGLKLKHCTSSGSVPRFLFDMRGFWADEKVDNGQWNLKNPFFKNVYRHYKKKEKEFLLNADGIVSLTQAAKDELLKNEGYKDLKIDVIPCCADLEHFNYEKINADASKDLKHQLGIKDDQKVISYLGSVGGWYMTDEMLSFYKCLLLHYPEFVFLILTKDDASKVKAEAARAGIPENKIIVTYAMRKDLPLYMSLSDCSIFFIRPTYSKVASSPTKHAELMGMGIPVICNDVGDTGDIVCKTHSGVVVKKFERKEYERTIQRIPELLSMDKKKIREAAFKYFDLGKGANNYLQIYRRILSN